MNSSDLIAALKGNISLQTFEKKISKEVEQYIHHLKKRKSTIPIIFNEDLDIFLTNSLVKTLLNEAHLKNLSNVALAYICDCLTLGEKVEFENQLLIEIIFEIADPEINGGFKNPSELLTFLRKIS